MAKQLVTVPYTFGRDWYERRGAKRGATLVREQGRSVTFDLTARALTDLITDAHRYGVKDSATFYAQGDRPLVQSARRTLKKLGVK